MPSTTNPDEDETVTLPEFETKNGFVIFERPAGSPPITRELIAEYEREDEENEYRRAFPVRPDSS